MGKKIQKNFELLVLRFKLFSARHRLIMRTSAWLLVGLMVSTVIVEVFNPVVNEQHYNISKFDNTLIHAPVSQFAQQVSYDRKNQVYEYNKGYTPTTGEVAGQSMHPKITAS